MADLSMLERRKFEELFGMASGYVLDFSNPSFASLFQSTVGINIYDAKYSTYGDSKAKRLRAFWELESNVIVGKIIEELLSFWKYQQECKGTSTLPPAYFDAIATCAKLQGKVQDIKFENSDEAFLKKTFEGAEFEKLTIP